MMPAERAWAAEWVAAMLAREGVTVSPEAKEHVWSALTSLASAPVAERTLTGLSVLLQSGALKRALQPYCLGGPWGRLLDAEAERLGERRRAGVRDRRADRHRRRARRARLSVPSGRGASRRPADPCSSSMRAGSRSMIQPSARDCANGSRRCARRTPASCSPPSRWPISRPARSRPRSSRAARRGSSCRTSAPSSRRSLSIYRRFGLNDRQIEIIARATPKRDYYCQSRRGNRLFELGLGEVALAFTAASSKTDQAAIAEVMLEHGRDGFAAAWLRRKGLDWAADLLDAEPSTPHNVVTPSL